MRSDDPNGGSSALSRFRARIEPARRWFSGRDAGPRRALALAAPLALAALVAGAYYASSDAPVERVALYDGHRFDHDAIPKILKALAAKGIECRADEGRVAVAPGQRAAAVSALEEANLGPRSPIDIIDQPAEQGLFDPINAVRAKQERNKIRGLEELVRNVDPATIDHAHIEVFRPQARDFRKPVEPRATVILFTESSRAVPPRTLAAIQRLLVGMEPDLKPESITVIGSRGTPYLIQGDPALMVESQAQARAEELAAQVQDKLRWIEGVKVSVRIDPAPAAIPTPTPSPAPAPTAPIVAPNAPMSLPADEFPTATVTAPPPVEAAEATGRVIVLVQVPIAYYLHRARAGEPARESSPGDLRAYAEKVENSIRAAVRHVAPAAKAEDVTISRIDATGPEAPEQATRKIEPGWALAAGLGLLAAAVLLLSFRAGRRPNAGPSRPAKRRRYDRGLAEEARGAGPSERVRELVRMDPEAAAGVLQRWIGQGGDSA